MIYLVKKLWKQLSFFQLLYKSNGITLFYNFYFCFWTQYGYTFVGEARSTDLPLNGGKWRMRLIGSSTPLPQPSRENLHSSFTVKEIKDYYIPNKNFVILRLVLIIILTAMKQIWSRCRHSSAASHNLVENIARFSWPIWKLAASGSVDEWSLPWIWLFLVSELGKGGSVSHFVSKHLRLLRLYCQWCRMGQIHITCLVILWNSPKKKEKVWPTKLN